MLVVVTLSVAHLGSRAWDKLPISDPPALNLVWGGAMGERLGHPGMGLRLGHGRGEARSHPSSAGGDGCLRPGVVLGPCDKAASPTGAHPARRIAVARHGTELGLRPRKKRGTFLGASEGGLGQSLQACDV